MLEVLAVIAAQMVGVSAAGEITPPPEPDRNWLNFRVGVSTETAGARPEMCLEIAPVAWLSIEGCGNGSGVLHHDPIPELAHFRGKLRLGSWRAGPGFVQAFGALGFAELQMGEDSAGFQFGGTDGARASTTGPEAGASVRGVVPMGGTWEALIEIYVAGAWLPHAGELEIPRDELLPSMGFSVGAGF